MGDYSEIGSIFKFLFYAFIVLFILLVIAVGVIAYLWYFKK